jgi:hypothetical protein
VNGIMDRKVSDNIWQLQQDPVGLARLVMKRVLCSLICSEIYKRVHISLYRGRAMLWNFLENRRRLGDDKDRNESEPAHNVERCAVYEVPHLGLIYNDTSSLKNAIS